jgi:hypothetical protein
MPMFTTTYDDQPTRISKLTDEEIRKGIAGIRDAFAAIVEAAMAFARSLVPVAKSVAEAINSVGPFMCGRIAGFCGGPRDWSMPDSWHRGYLAGALERHKKEADTPVMVNSASP